MSIFIGSRYQKLPITTIRNYEGELKQYIHLREALKQEDVSEDFIAHLVQEGEVLDLIAYQHYREENYWYVLAEVNGLVYPYDLSIGQSLVIPNKRFIERIV